MPPDVRQELVALDGVLQGQVLLARPVLSRERERERDEVESVKGQGTSADKAG